MQRMPYIASMSGVPLNVGIEACWDDNEMAGVDIAWPSSTSCAHLAAELAWKIAESQGNKIWIESVRIIGYAEWIVENHASTITKEVINLMRCDPLVSRQT